MRRIIYMGTPDFAVPALEALTGMKDLEVAAVVTQPDRPKGRSKAPVFSPVKEAALKAGIEVLQPEKLREEGVAQTLRSYQADLFVVAAYGQIIPADILKIPPYGCINIHASLLPAYRGAAPIVRAVINGETVTGVTIMQMDEGLDTGDILSQSEVEIAPDETGGSLFDKLAAEGAALLVKTLPSIFDRTVVPIRQPKESPTPYAAMIQKETGLLDFNRKAVRLECLIRGLNPSPCAYTFIGGKKLKVWLSEAFENTDAVSEHMAGEIQRAAGEKCVPGTVLYSGPEGICVQCKEGILLLKEVQIEGKKRMPAADFLRGFLLKPGTVLG